MKIVITDCDHANIDIERRVLTENGFETILYQYKTEDEIIRYCQDADILITQYAPITRKVLAALPNLKFVVRYGVGVDNIDVQAATEAGVQVGSVPDYGVNEVADQAMSLMLALLRKTVLMNNILKSGEWNYQKSIPIRRMNTLTVGIVGLGRIGSNLAVKLRPFGCRVIGYDVDGKVFEKEEISFVKPVSFDSLVESSDVISIHCPLIKGKTDNMFDAAVLRRMKPNAFLVNTARGSIVNEADLETALNERWIAGAALDVVSREPMTASPLFAHDNFIVTPHMSWYSEEASLELKRKAAEEAVRFAKGESIRYPFNHL